MARIIVISIIHNTLTITVYVHTYMHIQTHTHTHVYTREPALATTGFPLPVTGDTQCMYMQVGT